MKLLPPSLPLSFQLRHAKSSMAECCNCTTYCFLQVVLRKAATEASGWGFTWVKEERNEGASLQPSPEFIARIYILGFLDVSFTSVDDERRIS